MGAESTKENFGRPLSPAQVSLGHVRISHTRKRRGGRGKGAACSAADKLCREPPGTLSVSRRRVCEEERGVSTTGTARCSSPLQGVKSETGSISEQLGKDGGCYGGPEQLLKQRGKPTKPNTDRLCVARIADRPIPLRGSVFS